MLRKKILLVAGARPNFMKIAPLIEAIEIQRNRGMRLEYELVHTGQHFDQKMSEEFFVQLGIPQPRVNLAAGGGTQAEQTAAIMIGFERYLADNPCDLVIVVGDVTSTMACAIVAKKSGVSVAHVEAGIRSGDITMPEEINRILTDSIADYFFTTSLTANKNLMDEGKRQDQIFFVGNTMIDTLLKQQSRIRRPAIWDKLGLKGGTYLVMTLHRPGNVDEARQLGPILQAVKRGAGSATVIFPVHPRTMSNIRKFGIQVDGVHMIDPLGYLEFNFLVNHCCGVITDSGGITEETTVLGIPCMTLRNSTERPETVTVGTNELVGTNPDQIEYYVRKMIDNDWKRGSIPDKWDGKTAFRIVSIICDKLVNE